MNKVLLFSALLVVAALTGCMPDDSGQDFNAFVAQDKQNETIDCERLLLNGTPYLRHGLAAGYIARLEEEHHYKFRQCRTLIEAQRQHVCESKAQELGLPNKAALTFPYQYLVDLDSTCAKDLQQRLAENEPSYKVVSGVGGKPSFLVVGARGQALFNLNQLVHVEMTDGAGSSGLTYFAVDAQFAHDGKARSAGGATANGNLHAVFADEHHARRFMEALTQQTSTNTSAR